MTTYSAEVNIYNPDAIETAVEEAADAHKAYITEVSADNGIVVAAQGKGTVSGAITSATTGWHLADVLEYIKAGISRFWIGMKNQGDTSPTVRIGKERVTGATDNESYMELDYHSMQLVDKDGDTYFYVSDLRDTDGVATVKETYNLYFAGSQPINTISTSVTAISNTLDNLVVTSNGQDVSSLFSWQYNGPGMIYSITGPTSALGNAYKAVVTYRTVSPEAKAYTAGKRLASSTVGVMSFAEGMNTSATGAYSHAEGERSKASGRSSHTEGANTVAEGYGSHAEGQGSTSSGGGSHAEGYGSVASGPYAHAEGYQTTSSDNASHAEGTNTEASSWAAHAEGESTVASEYAAHAEGCDTIASEAYSHVEGWHTVAAYEAQHVQGKYNDNQPDNAFEIGNGDGEDARSNAFAVDWNGNVEAAGNVTVANHSSPIGSVLSNSKNSITRSGTAIDTMTNGASVTLTAGVWMVCGYWAFNTNSSGGARNAQVAIGTSGATDYYERVRVKAHDSSWMTLECSGIVNTSSNVTVYVKGSAGVANASGYLDSSHIKAVRIV